MKNHHFVQPVHELRGKLATGCLDRGALHFLIQTRRGLVHRLNEAHPALHQLGDLTATEVRGQENDRLRQVDTAVVTERQGRLVQDAQKQLPERVAGLLDFIKEQKAKL